MGFSQVRRIACAPCSPPLAHFSHCISEREREREEKKDRKNEEKEIEKQKPD
jgi:hypothetical protein